MERPIFKPVGTRAEDLDPSSLVVDAGVLEKNVETVHSFFASSEAKLRPHMNAHLCPALAHRQMVAGGTVGGIGVSTIGQAEAFAGSGLNDIFVTNVVATAPKIARLCALAQRAHMTVAVDDAGVVGSLSEAAVANGVALDVVVDVNTRLGLSGVEPGAPAVQLARAVAGSEGLNFAGFMTYEGPILADNQDLLAAESRKWIQMVLDTREDAEREGLEVGTVSVGGTHNYEIAGSMAGVTEVQAGSYALMDQRYRAHRPQLQAAARVLAVIVSTPEPGVAIMDAGQKAIGADTGMPRIDNPPGVEVKPMSAEHGSLVVREGSVALGDKVWVVPWDVGHTANLHDYMQVVRDGRLEAVWEVSARGRFR